MRRSDSSGLDIFIGLALAFLVAAPICALVTAATAETLWAWFMAPQYGRGPSMAAWYGVSLLVALMTARVKRERVETESVIAAAIVEILACVFIALALLATAALVRKMNGW